MSKPRMTEITDTSELTALHAVGIDVPPLFSNRVHDRIHFWANTDDLRLWRSARTSGETK